MYKSIVQKKSGILRTIVIMIIILAALLPAKYVNSIYGYLPFLAVLLLIVCSLLFLMIIKGRISFISDTPEAECQRGENISANLKIINKSFLICPKACAYLYISDLFSGDDSVEPTTFTMAGKSESQFSFDLKMNHIGIYTAGLKMMRVYDILGIFSIVIPGRQDFTVTVLPKPYLPEEIDLADKMLTETHNFRKSTQTDGFDYTGVREYALGDSMKRIHWKLSAHSSGYMTKITEIGKRSDLSVIIDFAAPSLDNSSLADIYDCLIESGLSLIEQAIKKDTDYSLIFMGQNKEITQVIPKGRSDYANLIRLMPVIYKDVDPEMYDGAGLLQKERKIHNRSSNIILCTSKITEQLIQELITVKQQQRNPMLYYVLPPAVNSHERQELAAPLKILDDYSIIYRLLTPQAVS